MPISINMSRLLFEPRKSNIPNTEVNMALQSNLTPVAEEREIHMMRAFHGIESKDEDETEETSEKKMSLLGRVAARHFAAKKAAQEAKVKKEEDVDNENYKSKTVKSDLKRVARKLRRAAVLSISELEESNMLLVCPRSGRGEATTDQP